MPWEGWKIEKTIPLGLIMVLIGPIVGGVWYVSSMESRVARLEREQTAVDNRDQRIRQLEKEMGIINERIYNIDRTTMRIEKKLDEISSNLTDGQKLSQYMAMDLRQLSEVRV